MVKDEQGWPSPDWPGSVLWLYHGLDAKGQLQSTFSLLLRGTGEEREAWYARPSATGIRHWNPQAMIPFPNLGP